MTFYTSSTCLPFNIRTSRRAYNIGRSMALSIKS